MSDHAALRNDRGGRTPTNQKGAHQDLSVAPEKIEPITMDSLGFSGIVRSNASPLGARVAVDARVRRGSRQYLQ
jgi:hypothetical protein